MNEHDEEFIGLWKKRLKKTIAHMLLLYILFIEQNCTGYMITKEIRGLLGHIFRFSAGSIYPQLSKLEERGLVRSEIEMLSRTDKQPRKIYYLTQKGYDTTIEMQKHWVDLISIINDYSEQILDLTQE